jgi:hypothetical protein
MGGKVVTWSFYVFAIFLHLFVSPGQPCRGPTKNHLFVTKITNFSKIYVFCDQFSNNFCVTNTKIVLGMLQYNAKGVGYGMGID